MQEETVKPIDMMLHCPSCGTLHIDAPDEAIGWLNPPHKSHLCAGCGTIWRPADVPTNGVRSIKTKEKDDTWEYLTNYVSWLNDGISELLQPLGNLWEKTGSEWNLAIDFCFTEPVCPTIRIYPDHPVGMSRYTAHVDKNNLHQGIKDLVARARAELNEFQVIEVTSDNSLQVNHAANNAYKEWLEQKESRVARMNIDSPIHEVDMTMAEFAEAGMIVSRSDWRSLAVVNPKRSRPDIVKYFYATRRYKVNLPENEWLYPNTTLKKMLANLTLKHPDTKDNKS